MSALLSFNQQQSVKPIAANNESRFAQWSEEVQERELKKLIGTKLYQDLVNNSTSAIYLELLNGGTFVANDFTYTQLGLRYVLAFFIYSEYLSDSKLQDTFAGFVKKNIPESRQAEIGEIKAKQNRARQLAFGAWEEIKLFLDNNTDTYEYWECANVRKIYPPEITKI